VQRLNPPRCGWEVRGTVEAAWTVSCPKNETTSEGTIATCRDRNVRPANEVKDPQCVGHGLVEFGVAAGDRYADQVNRGGAMRHHDCDRVVVPRIAIQEDRRWAVSAGPFLRQGVILSTLNFDIGR
jgi:hypothetical protein